MNIHIYSKSGLPEINYAKKELKKYLSRYSEADFENDKKADRIFELCIDEKFMPHVYSLNNSLLGCRKIIISGGSANAVLCGVYETLERMGLFFNISGEVLTKPFNISALDNANETIEPFCRNRGIRQHINFPMDISSYSLIDAKEYIRSLARMKMNAITFHSYMGQWHTCASKENAGNFFYGQRHIVPTNNEYAAVFNNRKIFCIPEAESIIDDNEKRQEFAVYWLRSLINTAKETGMKVTFSLELPDVDMPELINMIAWVVDAYPGIDALEFITEEGGGKGEKVTAQELVERAIEWYGRDAITADIQNAILEMKQLPYALEPTMRNLKRALELLGHKSNYLPDKSKIDIQIGLYVTCKYTLKIVKQIMDIVIPEGVCHTFLPSHGSQAVTDNINFMSFKGPEWQHTMVYSWVEFDGNMYIQQNSCNGIQTLLELAQKNSNEKSIHGICLNHWRTAENSAVIAYSARAMHKPVSTEQFYKLYADAYGIKNTGLLCEAMDKLADLDTFNRDNLFNIGFCYLGCWLNPKGLGWCRGFAKESIQHSINEYKNIENLLKQCNIETSVKGRSWLRLLINRCQCSVLHLEGISKFAEIAAFADDKHPEKLSCEEKENVSRLVKDALKYFAEYMHLHIEEMPDRGCEGTLASYWATIPVYADHIMKYFVEGEKECRHKPETYDMPPPPDVNNI